MQRGTDGCLWGVQTADQGKIFHVNVLALVIFLRLANQEYQSIESCLLGDLELIIIYVPNGLVLKLP